MSKKTPKVHDEKNTDLENQLKRALADYANLQKRAEEEKRNASRFANAILIAKFLDVLDGLEAALSAENSVGLDLVVRKFKDVLINEGVKEIPTQGDFDPELHEGIATVPGEKSGQIAEVLQKGYTLNDRVLRPARVKVTERMEGNNG